jgi:hypothetical protein
MSRRAVELARTASDRSILGSALNNLGEALRQRGDPAAALAAYEEGYEVLVGSGDEMRAPVLLLNLAETARGMGDLRRAERFAQQASGGVEAIGRPALLVWRNELFGWIGLAKVVRRRHGIYSVMPWSG